MKQLILIFAVVLTATPLFSQWETRYVDNGFDPSYTIASCEDTKGDVLLKLEEDQGSISLYVNTIDTYLCSESLVIDVSYRVNETWSKYNVTSIVLSNKLVIIDYDLKNNTQMLKDFKSASELRIRLNDDACDMQLVYIFKMVGSSAAYQKVSTQ